MRNKILEGNLDTKLLLRLLSELKESSEEITRMIAKNIGKQPMLYRRAHTITRKAGELLSMLEQGKL